MSLCLQLVRVFGIIFFEGRVNVIQAVAINLRSDGISIA